MMVMNKFTKRLIYSILGIVALGFFVDSTITGSDIVDLRTSQAATQAQTFVEHEASESRKDLHYHAQERSLETVGQEIHVKNNLVYHQHMNKIKLKMMDIDSKVAIYLSSYLIALFVFLFFWHRLHKMLAQQEPSVKM